MRYLYIFSFLFVAQLGYSQFYYQRVFESPSRALENGGFALATNGDFYVVNTWEDEDDGRDELHITRHNLKGNVLWNFDYATNDNIDGQNLDIYVDEQGSAYVSTTHETSLAFPFLVRNIFKINNDGAEEWSRTMVTDAGTNFEDAQGKTQIIRSWTNDILFAGNNRPAADDLSQFFLSSLNTDSGDLLWSNLYAPIDTSMLGLQTKFSAIQRCQTDTTSYLVSGSILGPDTSAVFLGKLDIDGNPLWTRQFTIRDTLVEPVDMACGLDSTTVIVANSTLPNQLVGNIIMKFDSVGQMLWAKNFEIESAVVSPDYLTNVVYGNDGNIVVSGRYADIAMNVFDFLVALDGNGDVLWAKSFERSNALLTGPDHIFLAGDLAVNGDGYMLSGTSLSDNGNNTMTSIISTDATGFAICEEEITALVTDSLGFAMDTLMLELTPNSSIDVRELDIDTLDDYDVPEVILIDTFFCANDPIEVTIDAFHEFAEAYEWSTGDTTSSIFVEEEGEYMVTVTFDTLACFELCDTSIISQLEVLAGDILPNYAVYCQTEQFALSAAASAGLPPYEYIWSTGETTQVISAGFGDYMLTITDQCGDTIISSETLTLDDRPAPENPILDFDVARFCETNEYWITILNADGMTDIVWSTDDVDVTEIMVPGPGVYTVSATNCFQPVEGTIGTDDFVEPVDVSLGLVTDNSMYCEQGIFVIDANITPGVSPYEVNWSTGETDMLSITVTDFGSYTATVTDNCFSSAEFTLNITEELLPDVASPDVTTDPSSYCQTGLVIMTLNNADVYENFVWSTGQTDVESIAVEPGTYELTAAACNQTFTVSETAETGDLPDVQDPILSFVQDTFCANGSYLVQLQNAAGYDAIQWSSGQTNVEEIIVEGPGEYSVTVTECFQEEIGTLDGGAFSFEDLVEFPDIFFPVGNIEENKSFGPYIECPEAIETYELKIFSRWGNLMFESTEPTIRWNGVHDGGSMPSDVYYWYCQFSDINGNSKTYEGNVTLLRDR